MIERKFFIRNLFNSKDILNSFHEIEFEDFKTFIECVNKDTITLTKEVRVTIPLKTIEDIEVFIKLASENYICEMTRFNLFFENEMIVEFFNRAEPIKNKKYEVTIKDVKYTLRELHDYTKGFKYWTRNNILWVELDYNYNNMEDAVLFIIETYIKERFRFFKLIFDYESFNKATLEELHKIEFWLHQIRTWMMAPQSDKKNYQPIVLFRGLGKTLFVSKDFKLYINKQAFKEGNVLFDLAEHYNHNGNDVPYKELNKLRSYIDLNIAKNPYVDYYQNLKIMGSINEIPYITRIITRVMI